MPQGEYGGPPPRSISPRTVARKARRAAGEMAYRRAAAGRTQLAALAKGATGRGFGLVARRTAAALSATSGSGPGSWIRD